MKNFLRRIFAKKYTGKITYKQYQLAIESHREWKMRFIRILQGNENLSKLHPDELACPQSCQLGKWMSSSETRQFTQHPDFVRLLDIHERFHHAASKTLRLAMEKRGREVAYQLSHYGEFERTSLELTRCLHYLHHDHTTTAPVNVDW